MIPWPYGTPHIETQREHLTYKIYYKIVKESELQSPVKLSLTAIKRLFVRALTASGKFNKPIPGCPVMTDFLGSII